MGEPQLVNTRAAALSHTTGRIGETNLAETGRAGIDIARFRVLEQFKLQPSQRPFKPER